jgi:hypothetical protein
MSRSARSALLAVSVFGLGGAARGEDLPVCKAGEPPFDTWLTARHQPTGIQASSADKFLTPSATASDDCDGAVDLSLNQSGRFDDGIHAWIAAGRCKETVCGTAYSLEPFCAGVFATGECDLNNNIFVKDSTPLPRIASLLERHQCVGDTVGLPKQLALEGGTLCFNKFSNEGWLLHAEATPPYGRSRDALKAAWASEAEYQLWRKAVADAQMCVYGPVVGDTGHGLKAEVHPVNMYWWTRRKPDQDFASGGPYDLLLVQDASGRYGNEFGYVIRDPLPENRVWRGWSQAPLVGQFEIPIWVRDTDVVAGTCASESPDPAAQARKASEANRARQAQGLAPSVAPKPVFTVEPWKACEGAPAITERIEPPPLLPRCVSRGGPRLYVDVRAKNSSHEKFDVSADWVCRCETADCGGPGYLGYLRVDGRVGLDRDFWEGAIGLTVVDQRLVPAVDLIKCVGREAARSSRADSQAHTRGTVKASVRRILTRRDGSEQEDLKRLAPDATVDTLLSEVRWPRERPPVDEIRRPKEIELDVTTRFEGLDEETAKKAKVARTWTVEIAPLPATAGGWTKVIDARRSEKITVRLPRPDRPYKIRATVDLVPNTPLVKKPERLEQVLWTDRLALKPTEMERWIEQMSHICDEPVRARSGEAAPRGAREGQLPFAVRNLLSETGRRGEVTMTTLAVLAHLENNRCPAADRPEEQKTMMR